MKYSKKMRGGDADISVVDVESSTSDSTGDVMPDAEGVDSMMDQNGGKHRHSKKCKHAKKGKKSMKKRVSKKRSTKKRVSKRRSMKKGKSMRKGGGVFETAAVPFGLLGLQHYFKKNSVNKMTKKANRSFTKVRKMF